MEVDEIEMEAKDTVMSIDQWLDVIGCDKAYRKDMKNAYQKTLKELEKQAEISVNAGIKEVVEWLNTRRIGGYNFCVKINWDEWQAKLKQWGVEK